MRLKCEVALITCETQTCALNETVPLFLQSRSNKRLKHHFLLLLALLLQTQYCSTPTTIHNLMHENKRSSDVTCFQSRLNTNITWEWLIHSGYHFKGIMLPKMIIRTLFTHPNIISNLYDVVFLTWNSKGESLSCSLWNCRRCKG